MERDKLIGVAAMLFSVVVWGISCVSTKIALAALGLMIRASSGRHKARGAYARRELICSGINQKVARS